MTNDAPLPLPPLPTDVPPPPDAPPAPDVPLTQSESETERAAYAELLAFIKDNKDPDTEVTHATPEEFANTLD